MSLTAKGCNSQGKVNQYTVACGYFGYIIQNSRNYEDAHYTVDKIICVDHGVCTLIRTNYIVKPLEVINVSRHRVDYTVKSSVAKTYEVEAYLNVSGSETKNVVGLGKMQIFP